MPGMLLGFHRWHVPKLGLPGQGRRVDHPLVLAGGRHAIGVSIQGVVAGGAQVTAIGHAVRIGVKRVIKSGAGVATVSVAVPIGVEGVVFTWAQVTCVGDSVHVRVCIVIAERADIAAVGNAIAVCVGTAVGLGLALLLYTLVVAVDETVFAVRNAYRQMGFVDAQVTARGVRVGEQPELDLLMAVNEGRRSLTGLVTIQGNFLTKDKVIRRLVKVRPDARSTAR